MAFGWKGGIGTASRVVPARLGGHTLGVLVQANFGGVLTMDGVAVWRELGRYASVPRGLGPAARPGDRARLLHDRGRHRRPAGGPRPRRLAARSVFGLARTGSSFWNGSGDYAIAFSTAKEMRARHG